jgi:hypothetical protein
LSDDGVDVEQFCAHYAGEHCPNLADYRVKMYNDKHLVEGGDPEKPKDWVYTITEEYLCAEHYDLKYKFSPPPTPTITFVRVKR